MNYNLIGIIANGDLENKNFCLENINKVDFLIAANGGAKNCYKLGIYPDLIIGDIDSLPKKIQDYYNKKSIKFITFPAKKDKTDTEIAVDKAIELKPKQVNLFCMLGGRLDHTLANIFLLEKLQKKGIKNKIISKNCEIELVNKNTKINGKIGDIVSIISISKKSIITLEGFEYNLNNDIILRSRTLGISNILKNKNAIISVKNGIVLVIHLLS